MASQDVRVIIIGDSRSVERAFARSSAAAAKFDNTATRSLGRTDAAFTKFNKISSGAFVGGIAATAVFAGIKRTTDAASDLNEQISKNRQVFGQSAIAVESWSRKTAKSIGVSQTAALEATGTFGNLFDAIGVGDEQAAATSRRLVQLAADLASFNNADPSEVLQAIRSGLVGEAEPLRRFGVLLSEVRVQQVALAQTGKTNVKTLTDQEKALARVSIIFKDTANAQGDFARTSEGLANQQRILAARTADLEANLGRLLLPAVTKVTGALVDATDAALILTDALGKLGKFKFPPLKIPFSDVTLGGASPPLGDLVGDFLSDALDPKKIALRMNPAGRIALDLKKLGLLDGLFDRDKTSREITGAVDSVLKGAAEAVDQAVRNFDMQQAIDTALGGFKFSVNLTPAIEFGKQKGVDFGHGEAIAGAVNDILAGAHKALDTAIDKTKKAIAKGKATDAADARSKAFANFIGKLELVVDKAGLTATLKDDLKALQGLKAGLEKQIAAGVDVASAQSKLVSVTADIASKQKDIRANASAVSQAAQFKALGLDVEGNKPIPGIANLKKQLASLTTNLAGTSADTSANRGLLARIKKVLFDPLDKATPVTREKVRDLLQAVRDEFDKDTLKGPLTKTTAINTNTILDGLGLGRDAERELRARLSRFNSAGQALTRGNARTGSFVGGRTIVVENHNTIELDSQVVAKNVTKSQTKTGRGTRQKRGPNRRQGGV